MASTAKKSCWSKARQSGFGATEGWLQQLSAACSHTAEHLPGTFLPVLLPDCTTALQTRLTLHFIIPVTRHYPLVLNLLLVLLTMFYLLFGRGRLSHVSSLSWGKANLTCPIHHSWYLDNFSADQNKTAVRNGYQISEIRWHTASFPTSSYPVYSEQITCKKIDFYNCSWISSHFLISWTAASSPRHLPRLVSMEYLGSEQIILWWKTWRKNAEWIWRRNNFGEPNYNPLSIFLRTKFQTCIICVKRRKQPEKGRNK